MQSTLRFDTVPGSDVMQVCSVSEVTGFVKKTIEEAGASGVWVEGEITNFKHHSSGHFYFSLSEAKGNKTFTLRCKMWRSSAREVPFNPENGMKVLAFGTFSFYEPFGEFSLTISDLRPAGKGEKHLLVLQWKETLEREGHFDPSRKKLIPAFPRRIGVVTSPTGAARRDIEQIISRRFPVEIVLSPAPVQGDGAHTGIIAALQILDGAVDVIILGRGGGSFEDLFEFNHPDLVRAVAACKTPVISAVGHETDTTLVDFAADLRAPTPSAAAELVVPDREELILELQRQHLMMKRGLSRRLDDELAVLEDIRLRLQPRRLLRRMSDEHVLLTDLSERLKRAVQTVIERRRLVLGQIGAELQAYNPALPLEQGFAMIRRGGAVVTSSGALEKSDHIQITFADGSVDAIVTGEDQDEEKL